MKIEAKRKLEKWDKPRSDQTDEVEVETSAKLRLKLSKPRSETK